MTFLQRVEADLQRRREAATAGFIDELSSDGNDINSYNTWWLGYTLRNIMKLTFAGKNRVHGGQKYTEYIS